MEAVTEALAMFPMEPVSQTDRFYGIPNSRPPRSSLPFMIVEALLFTCLVTPLDGTCPSHPKTPPTRVQVATSWDYRQHISSYGRPGQ